MNESRCIADDVDREAYADYRLAMTEHEADIQAMLDDPGDEPGDDPHYDGYREVSPHDEHDSANIHDSGLWA